MNSYLNFELELADYQSSDGVTSFSVRVMASPKKRQDAEDKVIVELPNDLVRRQKDLQGRKFSEKEIIEFGEDLAKLLLPPPIRHNYFLSRAALKEQEGLRIQIRTSVARLAALAWEYIYVWAPDGSVEPMKDSGFLALDRKISIVRFRETQATTPGNEVVRIGALFSDGRESGHQELDMVREKHNLEQALIGVAGAELNTFPEGKQGGLLDWLTENNAQVFHFAGHGTIEKEPLAKFRSFKEEKNLVLVGEDGGEQLWDDERVAMLLRDRGIRLVVLSACDSGGTGPDNQASGGVPALVQSGIPAVVGMQFTVRDANAIAFSRQFYRALASGKLVDTAVSEGRQAIYQRPVEAERDWGVPVLYLQTDIALFPKPVKSIRSNLILLVLTLGIFGIWVALHVGPLWFDKTAKVLGVLGFTAAATPALFAFLKLLWSKAFDLAAPREQSSRLERILRNPLAKKILWPALVVVLGLTLTTSSVYLHQPDSDSDVSASMFLQSKHEGIGSESSVSGVSAQQEEFKKLTTNREETLKGGLFILPVPWRDLEIKVNAPEGWEWKGKEQNRVGNYIVSLSPLNSIHVKLTKKPFVLVRLLPTGSLYSELPAQAQIDAADSENMPDGWELRVFEGTKDGKLLGKIDRFRKGVAWISDQDKETLKQLIENENKNKSERNAQLRDCLSEDRVKKIIDESPLFLANIPLKGNIRIELFNIKRNEIKSNSIVELDGPSEEPYTNCLERTTSQ